MLLSPISGFGYNTVILSILSLLLIVINTKFQSNKQKDAQSFLKWSIWSLRWESVSDEIQFQWFISVHCIDIWRTKLRQMYNIFYFLFDDFIFFLYFGKLNHPKHFVLYSVCSKLYSIYLLTEYLSNGCLVSYLRSHGKGPFLPFTFLEVCWMSVLWSGTLIPEPRAHEGRQHSVHCCRPVSSTLKQSTLERRISWVVRDPQGSWWAVLVTCDLSAAPPELLCAEPAGCLCSADHNAFWGECQQRQCSCADPEGWNWPVLGHAPAFPAPLLLWDTLQNLLPWTDSSPDTAPKTS